MKTIFLSPNSPIYICDLRGWMRIHRSDIKKGMIIKFSDNEKEYTVQSDVYKKNDIYTVNVQD